MARTGRPQLPDAQKRSEQIVVRVTKAEKQLCEQAADAQSVSTWARDKLLHAARKRRPARADATADARPDVNMIPACWGAPYDQAAVFASRKPHDCLLPVDRERPR